MVVNVAKQHLHHLFIFALKIVQTILILFLIELLQLFIDFCGLFELFFG